MGKAAEDSGTRGQAGSGEGEGREVTLSRLVTSSGDEGEVDALDDRFGRRPSTRSGSIAVTSPLRLLLDTNVLIPLEPTTLEAVEELSRPALDFVRRAQAGGAKLLLHPAQRRDLARDPVRDRRLLRQLQLRRYSELEHPPGIPATVTAACGVAPVDSNDWVDHLLLAAVVHNAVDFLVTEDRGIHAKARRLAVADRVLGIDDAAALHPPAETLPGRLPTSVRQTVAHELSIDDPILESFRRDYPKFDSWWANCQKEARTTFVIDGDQHGVAGMAVVHPESDSPGGVTGRLLKLCSFKISERFSGRRLGELLLKSVLRHAQERDFDHCFVTVFPKHAGLIALFEDFGFEERGDWGERGEKWFVKPLRENAVPRDRLEALSASDFHVLLGPDHFRRDVKWYLVPIQPRYSDILLQETAAQGALFATQLPFGNALRKAYLCNAQIKSLEPGDVLAFYRSGSRQGVIALGVLERSIRTASTEVIHQLVARRTVYSAEEIEARPVKPVLVLLFRHAHTFHPELPADKAKEAKLFRSAPQSIMRLGAEGVRWIVEQMAKLR